MCRVSVNVNVVSSRQSREEPPKGGSRRRSKSLSSSRSSLSEFQLFSFSPRRLVVPFARLRRGKT